MLYPQFKLRRRILRSEKVVSTLVHFHKIEPSDSSSEDDENSAGSISSTKSTKRLKATNNIVRNVFVQLWLNLK